MPYLWIARWIGFFPFNRCSAPDSHDRRAHFIALSALSDKLSSGIRDSRMKASLSSPRAVFEFLSLAVRDWLIYFESHPHNVHYGMFWQQTAWEAEGRHTKPSAPPYASHPHCQEIPTTPVPCRSPARGPSASPSAQRADRSWP